tara:strand:- start:325 stop:678 length:354 start_codon:yes stop_codon:yes gene_type:complete
MSKEKRLQRKLDRMGKNSGNTADVSDGRQEVSEFIQDNGRPGQKRRANKLANKVFKPETSSYQAVGDLTSKQARDIDEDFPKSPMSMLGMGVSRCWKGYKPNPDGRPAADKGSCVKS